jgi:HEAT repeat protein
MNVATRGARSPWTMPMSVGLVLVATVVVIARADAQGPRDPEIAQLIKSLEEGTSDSMAAARDLIRIGRPAVPALIAVLKSPRSRVRMFATATLWEIGPVDERILPALVDAMGRVSSPPGWTAPFEDEDEGYVLAMALCNMGPDAVKPVIEALNHERPLARATAALALAFFCGDKGLQVGEAAQPERKPIKLDRTVIARLLTLLDDDHGPVRSSAAAALATIDPDDSQANAVIAALVKRLSDPVEQVRSRAVLAVSRFGPKAKSAVGILADWFQKDSREWVQPLVAEALGSLGAEAAPAVPMLIKAARDTRFETRENAIYALGLIGPKVEGVLPVVRGAMADPDSHVRSRASSALAALGGPEIPGLIEALRGPDVKAQKSAADALKEMGPTAAPAVPALIAHLADDDESLIIYVRLALAAIGAPAVPALGEMLGDENPRMRIGAAEVLGRIGPPAALADNKLTILRGDSDPEVKRHAAFALAALRPGDPASIDALVEAFRDEQKDADQRIHAAAEAIVGNRGSSRKKERIVALIEILARLRSGAEDPAHRATRGADDDALGYRIVQDTLRQAGPEALPVLLQALGREELQESLVDILGKIGAPAVAGLIEALRSDNSARRAAAAFTLAGIASSKENRAHTLPAVPVLTDALNDKDPRVRAAAASALGWIGTIDARATGLLIRQLADADEPAAVRASIALRMAKADTATAIPSLIPLFRRPERAIRQRAVEAMARIGPPAVPRLLQLLKEGDPEVRVGAITSLRDMQTDHHSLESIAGDVAIPLAEALKDEDSWVRNCAGSTLSCLGAKAAPALSKLLALLEHERATTRIEAIEILRVLGPPAVSPLIRMLGDVDPRIRAAAATSLGGDPFSSRSGTDVFDPLLRALKDKDASVRAAAVESLGSAIRTSFGESELWGVIEELFSGFEPSPAQVRMAKTVSGVGLRLIVGRPAQWMLQAMNDEGAASR